MKVLLVLLLATLARVASALSPAEMLVEGAPSAVVVCADADTGGEAGTGSGIVVAENEVSALGIPWALVPGLPPDIEPMREYGLAFAREIARDQHFPREALRQGWAGSVEIRVTVGADGQLEDVSVTKSSGHPILDEEAIAKVMRARELPQVPEPLAGREFTLTLPVTFRLE